MNTYTKPVTNRLKDTGSRDARITIQTPTSTYNATGEEIITWADVATIWAGVTYPKTNSTERFEGDQQVVTTSVIFNIRYRDDFNEKDKIVFRDEDYDILNIRYIGRNREIDIVTEKRI